MPWFFKITRFISYDHENIRGLKQKFKEEQFRVQKAADILELGQLLERKPKSIIGGQRQRVAMGRAIVRTSSLFI